MLLFNCCEEVELFFLFCDFVSECMLACMKVHEGACGIDENKKLHVPVSFPHLNSSSSHCTK